MQTNFFSLMARLSATGNIIITINLDNPEKLKVLVFHGDDEAGSNKQQAIEPLIFSASPADLDDLFFSDIEAPVTATESLRLLNKESHLKSVEAAKAKIANNSVSKTSIAKAEVKKEESHAEKKFNQAMTQIQELKGKERFREALGKLPQLLKDHPDKEESLKSTKTDLMELMEEQEFNATMQEVEELELKGLFSDAVRKLPSLLDYPSKEQIIRNTHAALMAKLNENTLFAA
ncbi:hypothetical protein [Chitinophaga rhizophila]|uniref:ParB-related ThiF-related cassette protein E domain-containing protein n=1 Tax=Chitinophaga rhizophila TaxID=2866212 RepID=A0ABS7GAE1_9BACT|nr:hypothetical protein [Chitinophaga rhizophila]MBW8683503.1 hypothetical protein [Chitinophaga rhizophila]